MSSILKPAYNPNNLISNPPLLRKVFFMPIIEQPSLNVSSNPLYADRKVNTSIENRTVYKIKPPLNISKLPSVFDLPRISKFQLDPIENKPSMEKQNRRPILKPIEVKRSNKDGREVYNRNNKSNEKFSKTSAFYFNMIKKMQSDINKNEINKLEKYLRDKEMANITLISNKSFIDKNITKKKGRSTVSSTILSDNKFYHSKSEFLFIEKTNTKCLHLPTLKIYLVIHLGYDKLDRVQDYISSWKRLGKSALDILCMIDNGKEYELYIEKGKGGNLAQMLRSVGNASEDALRSISKQIVYLIEYFTNKMNCEYSAKKAFDIESICFDSRNNNVKLFPIEIIDDTKEKIIDIEWKSKKREIAFYYGVTMINSIIAILGRKVESYIEKKITKELIEGECCLLHYIIHHNEILSRIINEKNFTYEFIDFLHEITKFDFDSEIEMSSLQNHQWLMSTSFTNKTSLSELISLSKEYNFMNEYYPSNNNIINFDLLCEKINTQLPLCDDYFKYYNIEDADFISQIDIVELSKEFRVNNDNVKERLINIYNNYFQNNQTST